MFATTYKPKTNKEYCRFVHFIMSLQDTKLFAKPVIFEPYYNDKMRIQSVIVRYEPKK